jgi:steroid 5-alpha reductase family enzyme
MTTILATSLTTMLIFLIIWAISIKKSDASIIDFYWGPGFAIIAWIAWLINSGNNPYQWMILVMLTLWGLRLGFHIIRRHDGEDARYQAMRARHGASFGRKSLWMVFGLQAIIQWLASSPALVMMMATPEPVPVIIYVGIILFSVGFALEFAADEAVRRFKADPTNKGKLLTSGLFEKIRHPQYLGEIILQSGLGLIAFGYTQNAIAFVGPIMMGLLITRLSGVPMLEEQLAKREGFGEWKARSYALWWKF